MIVDPPFDKDDSTAPACIRLTQRKNEYFDNLEGKTCYSTFYSNKGSSVKLMYSPLVMKNTTDTEVSMSYLNYRSILNSIWCLQCKASMGESLYEETIAFWDSCAEKPPKDFCKSELGSPLVCDRNGKARLYGMIVDTLEGKKIFYIVDYSFHLMFI